MSSSSLLSSGSGSLGPGQVSLLSWYSTQNAFGPLASCIVFTCINLPLLALFWRWHDIEPLRSRPKHSVTIPMVFNNIAYFLYALAIYLLHGLKAPEHACDLIYFPLAVYALGSFLPYTVSGARLYVSYTSGLVLIADSKIAQGLTPQQSPFRLKSQRFIVNSLQWVHRGWATAAVLGSHAVVVIVAAGGLYAKHAVGATDPLWCNTADFAWLLLVQSAEMLVLGSVLLALIFFVEDVYSMRNEGLGILFLGAVLGPFLYLTMFKVVGMPFVFTIIIANWWCMICSLIYPLTQAVLTMRLRHRLLQEHHSSANTSELGSSFVDVGETDMADPVGPPPSTTPSIPLTSLSASDAPSENKTRPLKRPSPRLDKLLKNDAQYDRLLQLSVKCFAVELIMFSRDLVDFRALYDSGAHSDEARLEKFNQLVKTYIAEQSPRELNMQHLTRKTILNCAARSTQSNQVEHAFDELDAEVRELIKYNILPLWRESMMRL